MVEFINPGVLFHSLGKLAILTNIFTKEVLFIPEKVAVDSEMRFFFMAKREPVGFFTKTGPRGPQKHCSDLFAHLPAFCGPGKAINLTNSSDNETFRDWHG